MRRFAVVFVALLATTFTACDIPAAQFEEHIYKVDAAGDIITIPVETTGVDHIKISSRDAGSTKWQHFIWDSQEEYVEGEVLGTDWVEMMEFIDHYPATRALAQWRSGITLRIKANNSSKRRVAEIQVSSFGAGDTVRIVQTGR